MFRFYFIITFSVFTALFFIGATKVIMHNPERFSENQKYGLVKYICWHISFKGRIKNIYSGIENLPEDGGYIMYPNHQGRYDAVGIILGHEKPCSIVIDSIRSHVLILDQVTDLLDGKRLDKSDAKNQVQNILQVAKEVSEGRRYILFPEGGYEDDVSDNTIKEFMPGSFKAAMKAKCPIVPVALVDSYKAFYKNSIRKITCQTHFLEPIYYEEYKDMNSHEISDLVKSRIESKINEVLAM